MAERITAQLKLGFLFKVSPLDSRRDHQHSVGLAVLIVPRTATEQAIEAVVLDYSDSCNNTMTIRLSSPIVLQEDEKISAAPT